MIEVSLVKCAHLSARELTVLLRFDLHRSEMEKRQSTVASMPFQASAPAKSVEMFIEESHGTTGARNTRYGDVAPG